ncbi:hypothetical protein [Rhizobium sp. L1K21]|uniref:PIN-like domain-containing protein n=1 Tax=Rhizobium sp. L1K21 TaxID=2954933 RepID=UPI002093AD91|nr:hypothetical protein [Rhizobium sp. L1K21]
MNVFFDNCASPKLASTLDGFIRHEGHKAAHIRDLRDLPSGRHSSDIEWISYLARSNEKWIFISADAQILRNAAERAALRTAGLHGFVMAAGFQKTPLHQVASLLIWRWPDIQ